ncbi:MAG: Mobile element protein, partial [uncultured Thermomicrobiales bacterium]
DDEALRATGRPVGADRGAAAGAGGARRRDRTRQPALRGRGPVPLPGGHPLARPAGALRGGEVGPPALRSLGEGRGVGAPLHGARRRGGRV